jgi:hypothetical protein
MCDDGGAAYTRPRTLHIREKCYYTYTIYIYRFACVCDTRRNNVKRKIAIFLFEIVRSVVHIIHIPRYEYSIHSHSSFVH